LTPRERATERRGFSGRCDGARGALSADFILGLPFGVCGLIALPRSIIPVYFIGPPHLGLLQAAGAALLSATLFRFGFFPAPRRRNVRFAASHRLRIRS
jgi:hypothetical protein